VSFGCWDRSDNSIIGEPGGCSAPSFVCPVLHELRGDGVCRDGVLARQASLLASKFIDGAPRLAAGVREIDGIDRFLPSLPASSVRSGKLGTNRSIIVNPHWGSDEGVIKGLMLFVPTWLAHSSFDGHVGYIV